MGLTIYVLQCYETQIRWSTWLFLPTISFGTVQYCSNWDWGKNVILYSQQEHCRLLHQGAGLFSRSREWLVFPNQETGTQFLNPNPTPQSSALNLFIHKCFGSNRPSVWKLPKKLNPPWARDFPWRIRAHTRRAFITLQWEPCLCSRTAAPLNKFRASGTWEGWNIPETH